MEVLSLFLSSVTLIDSSTGRESCPRLDVVPQAVRGLPRLRAPGIVPCIIHKRVNVEYRCNGSS